MMIIGRLISLNKNNKNNNEKWVKSNKFYIILWEK